jgi:hypothetical protein
MPSQWMADAKLRALWLDPDVTLREIAVINYQETGWEPDISTISKKAVVRMGLPPRRHSSKDLVPWKVKPEHNQDRLRYMLQAESRARAGEELSETDRKLLPMLHDLLHGRGKLMVVGYHEQVGFYLTERTDEDEDIIRAPKKAGEIRPDIQTAIRTLKDKELAEFAASEGLRPELLESADRIEAADLLRGMGKASADLDHVTEHDTDVAPSPARSRRRRRAG